MALAWACSEPGPIYGRIEAQHTGDLSLGPVTRAAFDGELTASCGPGGLTEDGVASIIRRPYLQKVQADSASLRWTARSDRAGYVVVTARHFTTSTPAEIDAGASTAGRWQYSAELRALEPDTLYCYEVRSTDDVLLASAGFRTAPLPRSREPVRFVALGDSGVRSVNQEAVIDAMKTVPFGLVLHLGDLAYREGTLAQLERNLFEPFAGFLDRIPLFPAIGNHDYRTLQGEPFRQVFATFENGGPESRGLWYSFDWGDIHVVVLDSINVGPAQTEWLDADLGRNQLPWTIVTLHHSPYSSGHHGSDQRLIDAMVPLFEAHRVELVLSGHDHSYERTHPIGGVTYIVTGGGGQGTRDVGTSAFTAFSEPVAHFVHGEVTGNEMRLRAIDGTGAEFDGVRIALDD